MPIFASLRSVLMVHPEAHTQTQHNEFLGGSVKAP